MTSPLPTPPPRVLLGGRYQLEAPIAEGGMGVVYEGKNVELGRRVAIKLLNGFQGQPEAEERFRREARSTSAIESEHIVQVFDVGVDPQLGLYMVMELLRGKDLAWCLKRGPLSPFAACAVALQAAMALGAAHAVGVVHRDLKPSNLLLCPLDDGSIRVKLVDFGIAKLMRRGEPAGALTRTGTVVGTPHYMSPEQAQALPEVDHRSDIYSLGAVLYEMLVGEPPVPEGASYEATIVKVVLGNIQPIEQRVKALPPGLSALVGAMLAREARDRLDSMTEVCERLSAIFPELLDSKLPVALLDQIDPAELGAPLTSRRAPLSPRARPPWSSSHEVEAPAPAAPVASPRWPLWAALAALGLAAAGVALWLRPAPAPAPAALIPAAPVSVALAPASTAPGGQALDTPAPSAPLPQVRLAAPPETSAAPAASVRKTRAGSLAPTKSDGRPGAVGLSSEF